MDCSLSFTPFFPKPSLAPNPGAITLTQPQLFLLRVSLLTDSGISCSSSACETPCFSVSSGRFCVSTFYRSSGKPPPPWQPTESGRRRSPRLPSGNILLILWQPRRRFFLRVRDTDNLASGRPPEENLRSLTFLICLVSGARIPYDRRDPESKFRSDSVFDFWRDVSSGIPGQPWDPPRFFFMRSPLLITRR